MFSCLLSFFIAIAFIDMKKIYNYIHVCNIYTVDTHNVHRKIDGETTVVCVCK